VWLRFVQATVEERLRKLFEKKEAQAGMMHPALPALVDTIRDLTMRGGKRLRPALLVAGFHSIAPDQDLDAVLDAAVAAELLQTFLLIHDDWMDQDETRRGRPSVHVMLSAKYGGIHTGASAAILAGNLAAAYAWEALTSAAFPAEMVRLAVHAFWEMEEQVAFGQFLDIVGSSAVETVHVLKSASYSVRGPLRVGALLGGGVESQLEALDRYAWPLGNAFQLRDDLLGTFGDPEETGKPVGNDLRAGRRTALVVDALEAKDDIDLSILVSSLGNPDTTPEEATAVARLLEDCGSRRRVEAALQECVDQALQALDSAPLDPHGVILLRALAERIAIRSR
jgi:geranylgeranyl diphosphate synthase type I